MIEIGCCKGGLSHLFALGASLLGYEFFTYDVRDSLRYPLAKAHHETVDIFEIDLGSIITGYGTTLLLCDGGDKRREFNTFAPLLKPGDIVGAHDLCIGDRYWAWSEISEADVEETCELQPTRALHAGGVRSRGVADAPPSAGRSVAARRARRRRPTGRARR